MPVLNGVGFSEFTQRKQSDFGHVLSLQMKIVQSIQKRDYARAPYVYVDLTAGPGIVNGQMGSPLIFLDAAHRFDMPFAAVFVDKSKSTLEVLDREIRERFRITAPSSATLIHGDHTVNAREVSEHIRAIGNRWVQGLVYVDTNGGPIPVDSLRVLAEAGPRIDILCYVSATGHKRVSRRVIDDCRSVGKKHLLVRQILGPHQWSFVLLTNWAGFPGQKTRAFHHIDSPEGQYIACRMNSTAEELRTSPPNQTSFFGTGPQFRIVGAS